MREVPLDSLISALIDYRGKTPPKSDTGIRLITAKVIKSGTILSEPAEFISVDTYSKWMTRGIPRRGDILITTEAPLGEVAQLKTDDKVGLAQRVILLRADPERVDPRFLFQFLRSPLARQRLEARSSGTTVSGIRQPELRALSVRLPASKTQAQVAQILGAIDDLIENNRRRIELLEQMAQAIYREWFVQFRYPGHESDELVDSALGSIPSGWVPVPLGSVVQSMRSAVKPGPELDRREYIPIDCIDAKTYCLSRTRPIEDAQSSLLAFEVGDVLFGAMRPYFHKVAVARRSGVTRSTCFVLRPLRGNDLAFALMTLFRDETVAFATAHSRGSTIPYAAWHGGLAEMECILPPPLIRDTFAEVVDPLIKLGGVFADQANTLAKLRDLLLPKLVTGEIDVSTLDLDAILDGAAV